METLPLTEYLNNLNLIDSPLTIIAVLLVSCAAHFTLFKFLLKFLADTNPNMGRKICVERYYITRMSLRFLNIIGVTGVLGTTLIIMYWLLSHSTNEAITVFCLFAKTVSPLFIAIHIMSLTYMHLFVSLAFFRFERQRIGRYLSIAKCTIQLRSGKELRGDLVDSVRLDNGFQYKLCLPDGRTKTVEHKDIESLQFNRTEAETTRTGTELNPSEPSKSGAGDPTDVNRETRANPERWGTKSDRTEV